MHFKKIMTLTLILLISSIISAQSVSEKRSFTKSVPINKETRLEVLNKYGDIHISTWNKDSAYILAEVEAFAPNQTKLNNMFDGIDINITETTMVVRAKTEFTQSIVVLLESFKGLTEKIVDYNSRVQINYYINVPDYLDIRIENQFGDIFMENNKGNVSVSLSNGGFEANALNKLSDLKLNFGDAEINSVNSGKIEASFSKLTINESSDLTINSISSRFNLKKSEKINVESRRDKFFIGDINEITGISYFTDYNLENLGKEIDLTLKYGSLHADLVDNRFDKINLISAYSDITLSFNQTASYGLEIRHINAFVVIPDKDTKIEKEVLNEDKKEYLLTGTYGNNPGTRKVRIDATRGNIYLK